MRNRTIFLLSLLIIFSCKNPLAFSTEEINIKSLKAEAKEGNSDSPALYSSYKEKENFIKQFYGIYERACKQLISCCNTGSVPNLNNCEVELNELLYMGVISKAFKIIFDDQMAFWIEQIQISSDYEKVHATMTAPAFLFTFFNLEAKSIFDDVTKWDYDSNSKFKYTYKIPLEEMQIHEDTEFHDCNYHIYSVTESSKVKSVFIYEGKLIQIKTKEL